jgi:hypothetical protein
MKLDKKIKEKVVETIGDKEVEEKVNESRDMILNYQDGINPKGEVTKKEIKDLLKVEKKKKDKGRMKQFFVSLLKTFELRKFRKRNKKILNHRTGV